MKKVLFLIHDLGKGGAEKVLVNLVNHLDRKKFDISVTVLFGGGVNEQYLSPDIHFRAVFPKMLPGNSHWMKLLTPEQLHRLCVSDPYDIEIAYLEGPSVRVISGCGNPDTRLAAWIHSRPASMNSFAGAFRSEKEARWCYSRFQKISCVSKTICKDFQRIVRIRNSCEVLYNTIESDQILELMKEPISESLSSSDVRLIAVGTLKEVKGFDRLIRVAGRLRDDGYRIHLYILGSGPLEGALKRQIQEEGLEAAVSLLGYQENPYKYMAKCDLFICSSYSEGFSSVVAESLIVGTPVCTTDVSGMREMLGDNSEYGVITDNSEEGLLQGVRFLLDNPEQLDHYRKQARIRGSFFSKEKTVRAVEDMLQAL